MMLFQINHWILCMDLVKDCNAQSKHRSMTSNIVDEGKTKPHTRLRGWSIPHILHHTNSWPQTTTYKSSLTSFYTIHDIFTIAMDKGATLPRSTQERQPFPPLNWWRGHCGCQLSLTYPTYQEACAPSSYPLCGGRYNAMHHSPQDPISAVQIAKCRARMPPFSIVWIAHLPGPKWWYASPDTTTTTTKINWVEGILNL